MSTKPSVYGEGNYNGPRKYDEATNKFVESGSVEEAARAATPKTRSKAEEMKRAAEAGLSKNKDRKAPAPIKEPGTKPAIIDPKQDPRAPQERQARKSR